MLKICFLFTELRFLAATKPKQLLEKLASYDSELSNPQTESSKADKKVNGEQVLEFTDISKVANDE